MSSDGPSNIHSASNELDVSRSPEPPPEYVPGVARLKPQLALLLAIYYN